MGADRQEATALVAAGIRAIGLGEFMSAPERPVLRYFGGKWMLAPWIIEQMPPHRIYVEPFGGAASVLMRKPRSYSEVYNDVDGEIVNVFRVLRNPVLAVELERAIRLTPYAREEFEASYEPTSDPVEGARRTVIRSFMGFGCNAISQKVGFRATGTRQNGAAAQENWRNYPDHIKAFSERLQGVVVENRPAVEVLRQQDTPETLHFVDPPYIHSTRTQTAGYAHEMSDDDHRELLTTLRELRGMVILCGYRNEVYDSLGWETREAKHYADSGKKLDRDRTEVLWLNPACVAAQSQLSLFGATP
jgi:DNA adenine methylase